MNQPPTTETPLRDRFTRTVCDCERCREHCRHMPGCLAPGDLIRIANHLGAYPAEILPLFRASPGALVVSKGQSFRIGTIVPRKTETGECVFLRPDGRCRIHEVAPFGCAYFDDHLDAVEGERRAQAVLWECMESKEYQKERRFVAAASGIGPAPETLRAEYK